jgi:hypothetical protein
VKTSRREFLQTTAATAAAAALPAEARPLSSDTNLPLERAARHAIVRDEPATDFFEGAVLGNGRMGVIVTTRPDSLKLYFGHNSVLDIRAKYVPMEKLGTFEDLWGKFKKGDRGWVENYNELAQEPVRTRAPRPWPCGWLLLGFDRRDAELLGYTLHIDKAMLEVRFLRGGKTETLQIFIELDADRLWMRMVDAGGREIAAPFLRIVMSPQAGLPSFAWGNAHAFTFRQVLPALQPDPNRDRALRVSYRTNYKLLDLEPKQTSQISSTNPGDEGVEIKKAPIKDEPFTEGAYQLPPANLAGQGPFFACVQLEHGLAREVPEDLASLPEPNTLNWHRAADTTQAAWRAYWKRSGVALDDQFLEETWYRNQYFMNCAARPGAMCPTLYGNWPVPITGGKLWSGEYVMDYNVEQLFWATFSSNHLENNLLYADLIDFILPVGRNWAKGFYQLPGVFIAQRHWPVQTPTIPVPWFGWGNHMSPTPWAMQGLWWHYLYSMDKEFLRTRAIGPMREAVQFLNAYMRRPEAHGPGSPWKDNKFHIYPTQSPEIWPEHFGEPDFSDANADLTFTKFLFKAYLRACHELEIEAEESTLIKDVEEILANFPEYPVKESPRGGKVFIDVAGATPDAIYNLPSPLLPVFPGEEYGLHSPQEIRELAVNTWRNQQNEGGCDLVFMNLQGARLGLLDFEKFKRELRYCQMPNGTFTDMTLEAGGRFSDNTPNDYMRRLGIWIENFALPVVINESLLQSYNGVLRLFPNWSRANGSARFETLRAVGAFLVSASYDGKVASNVRLFSERGTTVKLVNPWPNSQIKVTRVKDNQPATVSVKGEVVQFPTQAGERYRIEPT